ncbi:MAG TPA: hypothetical protein VMD74_02070 [Candidatus Methylomirabilis sp.]|nr:hypothetical protein [Candidatus Methylomirabilis sp.]
MAIKIGTCLREKDSFIKIVGQGKTPDTFRVNILRLWGAVTKVKISRQDLIDGKYSRISPREVARMTKYFRRKHQQAIKEINKF